MVAKTNNIGENKSSILVYQKIKVPEMSERDQLIQWNIRKMNKGEWMSMAMSIERDDFPVSPNIIRADVFKVSVF